MKYQTFEELYTDNRVLIDFEFKRRLYEVLEKLLSKIDYFQNEEHKEIDGFQCSAVNDVYRGNIENLEKFYKPLYNYIKTISMPLMEKHETYLQELKHKFIDILLPDSDIEKYRGTRNWATEYHRYRHKQMALAELLEGFLHYAYILGASNVDGESENHYENDAYGYSFNEDGTPKTTYAEHRRNHVREMESYGRMSWGNLVSSIYDMGCRSALERGVSYPEADDYGMQEASNFVKEIFKVDKDGK